MSGRRRVARAIARKGKEATIYLDGTIGGKKIGADSEDSVSLVQFREQIDAVGDVETLRVEINCEGGVVTDGMAMYHALRKCKAHKVGIVTGIAASMASVVLMACDEIRVAKGAYIMIHNPSGGARGDHEDLRKAADGIERMRTDLLDIYEARTGVDRTELEGYLDAETYFTAEQAVEAGIADAVDDTEARLNLYAVARLDPRRLPPALHKRVVAKAPLREGLRDLESALQAALREAYGTDQYPYVVDMFDDSVIFDLNGVLMSRPYTNKDGVVTLGDGETRVVRTYEKVPAALRAPALAKGNVMKGKNAKMRALEEDLAKLKAMAAEEDDDEPDEETDEEEEETEEKPKDAATSALVAVVQTVTGTKNIGKATAKLAGLLSSAGAASVADRAKQVKALIGAGKLLPSLKTWALACAAEDFRTYVGSIGGDAVLKLGATHTPPSEETPKPATLTVSDRKSPESIIASQFKIPDIAKLKDAPLPACVRAPGEAR